MFPCLTRRGATAYDDRTPYVLEKTGVRIATPKEWERLFGFPDDYTLVPYKGKPAADSPRYKALGNSIAVPVMRWIGERIQKWENMYADGKGKEVAKAAWGGEIPSPLPGHVSSEEQMEEMFDRLNCPFCGGSGHVDDCDEIQIKLLRERDEARGQIVQLYSVLNRLVSFADNQICRHEETHRGGLLWEICDFCGAKWADDKGGKPEFVEPKEISDAYRALGEIEKIIGERK